VRFPPCPITETASVTFRRSPSLGAAEAIHPDSGADDQAAARIRYLPIGIQSLGGIILLVLANRSTIG
jgi:hypothetical protein